MENFNIVVDENLLPINVIVQDQIDNTNVSVATDSDLLQRIINLETKLNGGELIYIGSTPPNNPYLNQLWLEIE